MTSEVKKEELIFDAAIRLKNDAERHTYVMQACGDDRKLRDNVESLLQAHESQSLLDEQVIDLGMTLDESALIEEPGTTIGRYKLLEKIGEGGMAVVYMAEQQEPIRRKVALKIIKLGMDTKSVIARFEAERQALAMMDHPNIAKVLDAGATETGRPYFVMELVKGASITDFCDTNNLSTHERLKLFVQVCQAVQHAHQKGIIHRDIKPTNVMVTLHDGVPVPKVIDFGIAKAINRQLTEKTLFTRYAQMIGTPAYMSPEQAEMSGLDIDIRTDVYSLGTLLYELLTGSPPFTSEYLLSKSYEEMQRIIREEEPTRPSTKISTLGQARIDVAKYRNTSPETLQKLIRADLDWIVMKTLEKDRDRRYDSVSEFAVDIKRYLSNEPVLAGPPSALYRLKKFIQRRRGLVSAIIAIVAALMIGIVATTAMYIRANRALQRESIARSETELVSDFFTEDMLASIYPEKAKGPEVTVRYILDNAVRNLHEKLERSPLSEAKVRFAIGSAYRKLGDYEAAEQNLKLALKIYREHLGPEHPSTLSAMSRLGSLYVDHGRFQQSEQLLVKAIELQSCVLGEKHADTIESMGMLGWQYTLMAKLIEADTYIDKVMTDGSTVLGEEHPIVLRAMSSRTYRHLYDRKYEDAELLARKGLQISKRVLGDEHEQSLYFKNLITEIFLNSNQYEAGTKLGIETLETCQKILGDEHPASLLAMRLLGDLYRLQGLLEKAAPLLEKSTELSTRVLGEQNLYTLLSIYGLSELYRQQGHDDKADALICRGMEITRHFSWQNRNPNMYFRFRKLAWPRKSEFRSLAQRYYEARDYESSLQVLAQLEEFEVQDTGLRPTDLKLQAISLANVGEIQKAQHALRQLRRKYDEREYHEDLKELYETERFLVGKDHETSTIWDLLAQEHYEKASDLFRILRKKPDFEIQKQTEVMRNLTKALTRQHGTLARAAKGRSEYGVAIYHYNEALDINPSKKPLLNELAQLLAVCPVDKIRDGTKAVSLAQQACELTNWDNALYIDTLACAYAEASDYAAAIRYEDKAIRTAGEDEHSMLRENMQQRLQLFHSGKPYRDRPPSLVAWWTFERSDARKILDASGHHFDGSLTGDAKIITDSERGHVLSLQGNGYVNFDDIHILQITGPMTLSFWLMAEVEKQYRNTIIDFGNAENEITCTLRENGRIFITFSGLNPGWAGLAGGSLIDNKWHHIIGIYDYTEIFLYIDGQLDSSKLSTGFMIPSKFPVCIGANSVTKKDNFTGLLDDIRIYNYALSESGIKALYINDEENNVEK